MIYFPQTIGAAPRLADGRAQRLARILGLSWLGGVGPTRPLADEGRTQGLTRLRRVIAKFRATSDHETKYEQTI